MCKIPAVNECTDMTIETKQTKKVSKEEGQDIRGHYSAFYLTWHIYIHHNHLQCGHTWDLKTGFKFIQYLDRSS